MRYEKTGEDIWTISSGTFATGKNWRIQKVAGVYYYDREFYYKEYGNIIFQNVYKSIDLAPVLEARNNDLRKWGELV